MSETYGSVAMQLAKEPFIIVADASKITEAEWHQQRFLGIGGSDAGAVLGLNPYKSRLALYLDKVETDRVFEGNMHTRFGKRMEPVIREWFQEEYQIQEGKQIEVYEYPYMMQSIANPFMLANIDGKMEHPELGIGIIEIKTASEMKKKEWKDEEIPDSYYCQIQHYLNVTGLDYCMIVALIGKELIWKYVPRNEEFIENLIREEKFFWEEFVLKKNPPAPDGSESSKEALTYLFPVGNTGEVLQMDDLTEDYQKYKYLCSQEKYIKAEIDIIKNKFMCRLGSAEVGLIGEKKITWKTVNKDGYWVKPSYNRVLRIS